jgi:hypothetical protein
MDGIELTDANRAILHYIAHEGAKGYIESALLGYNLLVHEFGEGICVIFTMNFHDGCSPMLKLKMGELPDDCMDRIDKIQDTIHKIRNRCEVVLITI